MSDEFIKVATQEIKDEIASIKKILQESINDSSIFDKSSIIEKHIHKIKGLAPMMGKEKIGEIATLIDVLLNDILEGKRIDGIHSVLNESIFFMEHSIENNDTNYSELKQKIKTTYSKFLD